MYNLYGVVVHDGMSCNSGHYYAFVKAANGIWYSMNDSSVMQVSLTTVLKQPAYILFYQRDESISTAPLAAPEAAVFTEARPVVNPIVVMPPTPPATPDPIEMGIQQKELFHASKKAKSVHESDSRRERAPSTPPSQDVSITANSMWHCCSVRSFRIQDFDVPRALSKAERTGINVRSRQDLPLDRRWRVCPLSQ